MKNTSVNNFTGIKMTEVILCRFTTVKSAEILKKMST